MDELIDWVDGAFSTIFNFFEVIIDCLTLITDYISMVGDEIGIALQLPVVALETVHNLVNYWPSYVWLPISCLLSLVLLFRVLSIILSGGS